MSSPVNNLFQNAGNENLLSGNSVLTLTAPDIGQQITQALSGSVDVNQVTTSEVMLVGQLVDDSGSIAQVMVRGKNGQFTGVEDHSQLVRDGHNLVLDAFLGSKQGGGVLAHCRYLNGTVLYPFVPLTQAVRMNDKNYDPNLGTPLYDASVVFLGTILAKAKEFDENGVPARSASLIVSDGADLHSRRHTASDVATLVADMLRQEIHIVAAMGIDDNGATDFWEVFTGYTKAEIETAKAQGMFDRLKPKGGMGILPKWVLTPKNSPSELRKAFQVFSQSAVRASQNAGSFSQVAMGGFGN